MVLTGHRWDNTPAESFSATVKQELVTRGTESVAAAPRGGRRICRTLEPAPPIGGTVTAQPEHHVPAPRIAAIAHTIDAVAAALNGAKRMAFYAEIGRAEEGDPLNTTLRKWWMEAMFDSRPGREQRLADADAGRGLTALPGGEE
jgi:hypothetical protein